MSDIEWIAEELCATIKKRQQQMEKLRSQLLVMQGELHALSLVKKMIKDGGGDTSIIDTSKDIPHPAVAAFQEEAERRASEGICKFKHKKADGGHWCEKKLRGKAQKECGFCKEHRKLVDGQE